MISSGSYIIYFMVLLCYILSLPIIYYWLSSTCYSHIIFYFFCAATPAFVFVHFRYSVRFSSSALMNLPFCFTLFSFPSLTLLSISPLLNPSFPNLTSLYWLSITKPKAFALSSPSDSYFSFCPSILFSSCFSIFDLLNTLFSF